MRGRYKYPGDGPGTVLLRHSSSLVINSQGRNASPRICRQPWQKQRRKETQVFKRERRLALVARIHFGDFLEVQASARVTCVMTFFIRLSHPADAALRWASPPIATGGLCPLEQPRTSKLRRDDPRIWNQDGNLGIPHCHPRFALDPSIDIATPIWSLVSSPSRQRRFQILFCHQPDLP
jgi:hypothetical protein